MMSEEEVRKALIGWEAALTVALDNPGQWSATEMSRMDGYVAALEMVLRGTS